MENEESCLYDPGVAELAKLLLPFGFQEGNGINNDPQVRPTQTIPSEPSRHPNSPSIVAPIIDAQDSLQFSRRGFNNNQPSFAAQNSAPLVLKDVVTEEQKRAINNSWRPMRCRGHLKDFLRPCAVAVDSQDHIIVVDAGSNLVMVYNRHGDKLFSFGNTGSGIDQLVNPIMVAADPQTNSIVLLEYNSVYRMKIYDQEGKFQDSFLPFCVDEPNAMTVSKKSEMATVQFSAPHVVMYDLSGKGLRTMTCNDLKCPTGIAVGDREVFISDSTDDCIKAYSFKGHLLHTFSDVHLTPSPIGVAIARNGRLAVVDDNRDFRMLFFRPMGIFSAGYSSLRRHVNIKGFALTSNDDVVIICDDGRLYYYDALRSPPSTTLWPERWLTKSPQKKD